MTFYYRIEGTVQGVAFRYYTAKEALKLGISGTVRNLHDGSVEIYASSDSATIREFEDFLKKNPGHSAVEKIIKKELADISYGDKFEIIY